MGKIQNSHLLVLVNIKLKPFQSLSEEDINGYLSKVSVDELTLSQAAHRVKFRRRLPFVRREAVKALGLTSWTAARETFPNEVGDDKLFEWAPKFPKGN